MIQKSLQNILKDLPSTVKLVAVTKSHPVEIIREAYDAGHRIFGENRVQELIQKQPLLPPDIEWHMIGHLQTNKVKFIAPFIRMIHSVDSIRLLLEINKEALKNQRVIDCLLQVYIAREETKFGLNENELFELLLHPEFRTLNNVRICGLMGIATFTDDKEQVRQEFKYLSSLFNKLKVQHFAGQEYFKELSMGMSGDWRIAIEEGSTIVRVGSAIFGERNYQMNK